MVPSWLLNRDNISPINLVQQDLKKQDQEKEKQRREEEEKQVKLPPLHHLFDETSIAPLSPHYPPFKPQQAFQLVPPSSKEAPSRFPSFPVLDSQFDTPLTSKEMSDLHAFRQHDSQRYSYPFENPHAPSLRDPYGGRSPPLPSAHYPPPSHTSTHPSTHTHTHSQPSPLLNILPRHPPDPREDPYPSYTSPPSPPSSTSSSYFLGSRRSDLHHHSDARNPRSESRKSETRNSETRKPIYKNTDIVSPAWSADSPFPFKFHPPSYEVPLPNLLQPDGYRGEKFQAVPGTPSPQQNTFPHHFPPRPPSHLLPHPPPTTSTRSHPLSPASHPPAPTYGEFEENEYNIRAKNPASSTHPAPNMSPEQKRRRRIINKALSKGQTMSRDKRDDNINEEGKRFRKTYHLSSTPQVKHVSRRCLVSQVESKVVCKCEQLPTGTAVECDSCEKWFHTDCTEASDEIEFYCKACKSARKKARTESDGSTPKETSDSTDQDLGDLIEEEETGGIRVGNEVVSLSTLAKQPWIDGWATARVLAVQYLQEAKKLGNEITETRKLPKQISVRMSTKGKRPWRQAEVLLAIQFLKTAELVETSTRKGTLVKEPYKTMDDLIARALSVQMPTTMTSRSRP